MIYTALRWIGDESLLNHLVSGLPTIALLLIIAVCIVLLSKGADWMIDGVVDLAQRTGLPKIVIGATVIWSGQSKDDGFALTGCGFSKDRD